MALQRVSFVSEPHVIVVARWRSRKCRDAMLSLEPHILVSGLEALKVVKKRLPDVGWSTVYTLLP